MARTNAQAQRLTKSIFKATELPIRKAVEWLLWLLSGLILSRAAVFQSFSPLGLALTASYGGVSTGLGGLLGAVLGYLTLPDDLASIRYVAGSLIIFGVKFFLREFKELRGLPALDPLIAVSVSFSTGLALVMQNGYTGTGLLMVIAEAVLCGGSVLLIKWGLSAAPRLKGIPAPGSREFAGMLLLGCTALLALSQVRILYLSPGAVLGLCAVLLFGCCGGPAAGSVAGAVVGIAISLGDSGMAAMAATCAFAGLMAGLASSRGRAFTALIYFASGAALLFYFGGLGAAYAVVELLLSVAVFLVLPKKWLRHLQSRLVTAQAAAEHPERTELVTAGIADRIRRTAGALRELADAVTGPPVVKSPANPEDITEVFHQAANKSCRRCGLSAYCWGRDYNRTMEGVNRLSELLRDRGKLEPEDLLKHLPQKCVQPSVVASAVNEEYREITRPPAPTEKDSGREALCRQYRDISLVMTELSDELSGPPAFDHALETTATALLREYGARVRETAVLTDGSGKMEIAAGLDAVLDLRSMGGELREGVEKLTGRRFSSPELTAAQEGYKLTFREKEQLTVLCSKATRTRAGEEVPGDSSLCVPTGDGHYLCAISDGMGSGREAARDSAFALRYLERLISAGMRRDSALRLLNSALAVQGGEESLTTVDAMVVSLYSGDTEFIKAGAAPSFVIRDNKAYRVESGTLPVGILPELSCERTRCRLTVGDVVVMLSDGVLMNGEDADWLTEIITDPEQRSDPKLAHRIAKKAGDRSPRGRDDDITVMLITVCDAQDALL